MANKIYENTPIWNFLEISQYAYTPSRMVIKTYIDN